MKTMYFVAKDGNTIEAVEIVHETPQYVLRKSYTARELKCSYWGTFYHSEAKARQVLLDRIPFEIRSLRRQIEEKRKALRELKIRDTVRLMNEEAQQRKRKA